MRKEIKLLAAIAIVVIIGAVIGANYYRNSAEKQSLRQVTPAADMSATLVRSDSPAIGPHNAKVTLVEFYDPECEACAAFHSVVKNIVKENDGRIRYVARYMPLHKNSMAAANFIEYASENGKYWQAQDLVLAKQPEWGEKHGAPATAPQPDINSLFSGYAKELGLDPQQALAAMRDNRYASKVERDRKDGQTMGVRRTPTFFVNGRELLRFGEPDLRRLIDEEMKK